MELNQQNNTFSIVNKEGYDLIVYQCGMEKCNSGHSFGPALRDHFLIHYILKGSGNFYVGGKSYRLSQNQGFLICPDIITYYEADYEDPWIYTWVGFKGIKAEHYLKLANLSTEQPIFNYNESNYVEKCFEEMRNSASLKYGADLRLQGILSLFLSELIEKAENHNIENESYKEVYIKKTLQFIEANYSRDISISNISEFIGLNKNYFSAFFKENMKITPQEFLINFRINKACDLLENNALTVSNVARSVGYNDPLGFSKIFKRVKGCSPKKYRENSK
jgi:AraC-like DNA-binding protein